MRKISKIKPTENFLILYYTFYVLFYWFNITCALMCKQHFIAAIGCDGELVLELDRWTTPCWVVY